MSYDESESSSSRFSSSTSNHDIFTDTNACLYQFGENILGYLLIIIIYQGKLSEQLALSLRELNACHTLSPPKPVVTYALNNV